MDNYILKSIGGEYYFYNQRRMRWTSIKPTLRKRMGSSVNIDPLLDQLVSQPLGGCLMFVGECVSRPYCNIIQCQHS